MPDRSNIAFEMLYIDRIKANYSDIQTNIGLCEIISKEIFSGGF